MTTVLNPPEREQQEQKVVLRNVRWETYERLLADFENSSAPRLAYDRGTLEILSPLPEHERYNRTIAQLVEVVAEEWDMDTVNLGSTTFREASRSRKRTAWLWALRDWARGHKKELS